VVTIILFILGLCLGSFISATVWRLHDKKDFVRGRSQCPACKHQLAPADLVPIFSYLALGGRCRYCHQPIGIQEPLIELTTGLVFALSYLLWPADLGDRGNLLLLLTWLVSSVGLIALAVYDLRWMLLPSKIIYPTFLVAAIGQTIYLIGYAPDKFSYLLGWLTAIAVASGVFWTMFMISGGHWIGYGDVRLGLITGTLLAKPSLAFLMIFIASLLGTAVILPVLALGNKNLSTKVPYGPFLIAATFFCMLYGQQIVDWYRGFFIS